MWLERDGRSSGRTTRAPNATALPWVAAFTLSFLLVVFAAFGGFEALWFRLTLALLISVTAVIFVSPVLALRRGDVASGIPCIFLWLGVNALYWIFGSALFIFLDVSDRVQNIKYILFAQFYFALGALMLISGYLLLDRIAPIRAPRVSGFRWPSAYMIAVIGGFWLAFALTKPDIYIANDVSTQGQINTLASLIVSSLAWVFVFSPGRHWLLKLLCVLILADQLFFLATTGSRTPPVMFLVTGAVLAVHFGYLRLNVRAIAVMVALVAAVLVFSQFVRVQFGYLFERQDALTVESILADAAGGGEEAAALTHLERSFVSERLAAVDPLAAAVEESDKPGWRYMHGGSLINAVIGLTMPSAIFPWRPETPTSEHWLWAAQSDYRDTHNNVAQDLFINFGLPGVVAGMFLLGLYLRAAETILGSLSAVSTAGAVNFAIFVNTLLHIEKGVGYYVLWPLRAMLLILILSFLIALFDRYTTGLSRRNLPA